MVTILGPTATGKTRVAVALARATGGEIISADSRQVYRGMDIGTGKDLEEYTEGGPPVPYHLIDIVDPGHEFSVFEFQKAFVAARADIAARGRLTILCGGSGLYLESVLAGYQLKAVPRNPELRRELGRGTHRELVDRLARSGAFHNVTDTRDRERLVRAIEIAEHRGGTANEEEVEVCCRGPVFGLRMERDRLRGRIHRRLRERLEAGLVEEVESLLAGGLRPEQLDYYGLEYRYVTRFVRGEINRNDMTQKLASAIGGFAKRQETWFRRMEKKGIAIIWLDAERSTDELLGDLLAGIGADFRGSR